MSKFINRKADARQGTFLAVKVNSLNSSDVLCSCSSLSLLMGQSSPYLSQRTSQVRNCTGSDTTVPTFQCKQIWDLLSSWSQSLSDRSWTPGPYHMACWGQPPFIWHERTPFPFHCCIWPLWKPAKRCTPTFWLTLPRYPCPTLPLVSHIFPTALFWGSKKFWTAFPTQTMAKHKARSLSRGLFHSSSLSVGSPADWLVFWGGTAPVPGVRAHMVVSEPIGSPNLRYSSA